MDRAFVGEAGRSALASILPSQPSIKSSRLKPLPRNRWATVLPCSCRFVRVKNVNSFLQAILLQMIEIDRIAAVGIEPLTNVLEHLVEFLMLCLLYTSPSPRDRG